MTQDNPTNPTDQHIELDDGRKLAYAELGDPEGWPLFMFHGFPGSRLQAALIEVDHLEAVPRVIGIDRPGWGGSSFKPGRTLVEWPADVTALADALGLDRFAVMGLSGGGPYAAVCARFIPERLRAVALVSGVGPLRGPGATKGMPFPLRMIYGLGRYWPGLAGRAMAAGIRNILSSEAAEARFAEAMYTEMDRRLLERPEVAKTIIRDMTEAFRQDGRIIVSQELGILTSHWGFELAAIEMEVHLFHGESDANAPVAMGRYQASQIPNCRAHFYPGEGHFTVAAKYNAEILDALAP